MNSRPANTFNLTPVKTAEPSDFESELKDSLFLNLTSYGRLLLKAKNELLTSLGNS